MARYSARPALYLPFQLGVLSLCAMCVHVPLALSWVTIILVPSVIHCPAHIDKWQGDYI